MARGFLDDDADRVTQAKLVDIAGQLMRESNSALLVDFGDATVWLPKSLTEHDGRGTFTLPEWLAQKKGLL